MRTLRLLLVIVLAVLLTIWASGIASAADRSQGGGRSGDYSSGSRQGSHSGSYSRGGSRDSGRSGSYYRGDGRHDSRYRHDHHDWDFDVWIGSRYWGSPWYYPYYYPFYYPYYYYPYYYPYAPEITVPSEPREYIERSEDESPSEPSDDWYYCPESKAYYPYVRECPKGWQTVPAQPPSGLER